MTLTSLTTQLNSLRLLLLLSLSNPQQQRRVQETMKASVVAAVLVALLVAQLVAEPAQAVTCGDVDMCLAPCVTYITGQQPEPAAGCCGGVRRLKTLAGTTADRRFACGCAKQAAAKFQNLKDDAVNSLPRLCGTPVPFPISMQVDCTSIP